MGKANGSIVVYQMSLGTVAIGPDDKCPSTGKGLMLQAFKIEHHNSAMTAGNKKHLLML